MNPAALLTLTAAAALLLASTSQARAGVEAGEGAGFTFAWTPRKTGPRD